MGKSPSFILVAAAAALVVSSGAAQAKPIAAGKLVMRVNSASVMMVKKGGPVRLCARGTVPTGGWTHPTLTPRVYVQAPPDGIWDFDFKAVPPAGIVPQMLTQVRGQLVWNGYYKGLKGVRVYKGLKGVRVHGTNNAVVAKLGALPTTCLRASTH
jgi:hypothetical protein